MRHHRTGKTADRDESRGPLGTPVSDRHRGPTGPRKRVLPTAKKRADRLERRPPTGIAARRAAKTRTPQFRDGGRLSADPTGQSGAPARERRPLVGTAARRAAKGAFFLRTRPCTLRIWAVIIGRVCTVGERSTAPFARLRRAVPAPTGRTGRRSAFPCLRVAPPSGLGAETCTIPDLHLPAKRREHADPIMPSSPRALTGRGG